MIYWPNTLNAQAEQGVVPSLKNSRVLYKSAATGAVATFETAGYAASNVLTPDTYSWWVPGEAATLTLSFPEQEINCVGIAAHNLGSAGVVLTLLVDGSPVLDADPAPEDNSAVMMVFPATVASQVTIAVSGDCRVGVAYVGRTLDMVQPAYMEHSPVSFASRTTYLNGESVTGQFLGRTIERVNKPFSVGWSHLREEWVRQWVSPFLASLRTTPFFIAQRPAGYPHDVAYAEGPRADVVPERMGIRSFMRVAFEATGHSEAQL